MAITFEQIAGLIAAIAFDVWVVFMCRVLAHLVQTVKEMNKTVDLLTQDVDKLANNVDRIMDKTNTLMEDVNSKSKKLDPLFQTAVELSESIADLNQATRKTAEKISESASGAGKVASAFKMGKTELGFVSRHLNKD